MGWLRQALISPAIVSVLSGALHPQSSRPSATKDVAAAIDKLGVLDYSVRAQAARTVRRAPSQLAVPALLKALDEHADGYVRFRALVLLSGFNDPRIAEAMTRMVTDPNDRLREVAYLFFSYHPSTAIVPTLERMVEKETNEFVRPALIRALAAHDDDPNVQQMLLSEVGRGEDFFRSAVIEALGDYKAVYSVAELTKIAQLEGPLQDDAALALGQIGDRRAIATLAGLQRTAPRVSQPIIAAAICLLGVNCSSHVNYLIKTLQFSEDNIGFQDHLRSTAVALAAVASAGQAEASSVLFDIGVPSQDPARAPIALAAATVAVRNPIALLTFLESRKDLDECVLLLRDGFDMLEEHYDEERFFVAVRRAHWQAPAGSTRRKIAEALIQKLDF